MFSNNIVHMFNLEKILLNKIVIGLKDGFDALLERNMVFVHINHHFYCTLAACYPSGQPWSENRCLKLDHIRLFLLFTL